MPNKEKEVKEEVKAEAKAEVAATGGSVSNFDFSQFDDYLNDGATGLESLDQTDLKLPKIKLIQPTSEEAADGLARPGQFYNTITKEVYDKLPCILLALGKSRVMWPDLFNKGDKPLCRSFDGKQKTEGIGCKSGCAACEYAQWPADGSKPKCTQGYIWLALDTENRPFRLSAQGASVSPTKDFLNMIAPKLKRGKKHIGIFVFKMELTSVKQKNDKGVYFTIEYGTPVGTINPEDYNNMQDMSDSLREMFLQAIEKDTLDANGEDYGDTTPANDAADESVNGSGPLF